MQFRFRFLLLFLLLGKLSHSQYSISGYLDASLKNKKVYLSILKFDELNTISHYQDLTSTITDSLGFFSFEGNLLSSKHALYRIYSNIDENIGGVQKYETEDLKNFHNFIFSNTDTIVFQKNEKFWFSSNTNTNPIDNEWRTFGSFSEKYSQEFADFSNQKVINRSSSQFLLELKSFVQKKKRHPLTTLILLGSLPKNSIKKDLSEDPEFYQQLQNDLNSYYDNSLYALQFKNFLLDLSQVETRQELLFFQKLSVGFGILSTLLLVIVIYMIIKMRTIRRESLSLPDFNLTAQEEKVADLILENKTNKEIATELFISLNTVKTHIRNLYAKLEVTNRTEFVDIYKNHPRD